MAQEPRSKRRYWRAARPLRLRSSDLHTAISVSRVSFGGVDFLRKVSFGSDSLSSRARSIPRTVAPSTAFSGSIVSIIHLSPDYGPILIRSQLGLHDDGADFAAAFDLLVRCRRLKKREARRHRPLNYDLLAP